MKRLKIIAPCGILLLASVVLFFIVPTDRDYPFFNKGTAVALFSFSIFYTLFSLLFIKNKQSINFKKVLIPFGVSLAVSVILYFILGYTQLFRVLLLAVWAIGAVYLLVIALKNGKQKANT